jgi:hypothetical protein
MARGSKDLERDPVQSQGEGAKEEWLGGAIGAGSVLVVLPSLALFFGMNWLSAAPGVGLPILAIFGIMILFGALALVSTLFQRLGLSDRAEALALPNGSIRATIALALIVLFAIIAIMLYESLSKPIGKDAQPYSIPGIQKPQLSAMLRESERQVLAVVPDCTGADCPQGDAATYTVFVAVAPSRDATDLAKQLLILIGTLMTSVTSYYFAARAAEKPRDEVVEESTEAAATVANAEPEDGPDACSVPFTDATPDEELPPARGGVSAQT